MSQGHHQDTIPDTIPDNIIKVEKMNRQNQVEVLITVRMTLVNFWDKNWIKIFTSSDTNGSKLKTSKKTSKAGFGMTMKMTFWMFTTILILETSLPMMMSHSLHKMSHVKHHPRGFIHVTIPRKDL